MKVLITGGTGTIGTSFIKEFYDEYEFYTISRNGTNIAKLQQDYPKVTSFVCDICNLELLINIFEKVKPDIVIHTAALKHINLAEENPTQAVEINIIGSLNVIKASIRSEVPITVGISTDKACNPCSTYGYTKNIMEYMFMENHNEKTKFVCTRFANVAGSNGSVIPLWKEQAQKGESLKLTDPYMNRLMFSKRDAVRLIRQAIGFAKTSNEPVIICQRMESVNMFKLAKMISDDVVIIGERSGERLNETLISERELPYTQVTYDYVYIFTNKKSLINLEEEYSSATAEKMNSSAIKKLIDQ